MIFLYDAFSFLYGWLDITFMLQLVCFWGEIFCRSVEGCAFTFSTRSNKWSFHPEKHICSVSVTSINLCSRYHNRPFSYSEKNQEESESNDILLILKNFRMCTIVIEALTPINRTSRMNIYKNSARSRLFCIIAKRSMG